ncbi:MAG: DUF1972 domain-containing protein [Candidatus Aminicenantes bacterium]|nr:DUF1972 domain-containing protein [Candidatus Aminicenantes bacterium]
MLQKREKIAILGSRGIPAKWGGFETLAEELSKRLFRYGYEPTVVCENIGSHIHQKTYKGIHLKYVRTVQVRGLRSIVSHLVSVIQSRKGYDIIYMLGYHNAIFLLILKLYRKKIWINMDGLEWKRSKWGFFSRNYLRVMEKIAMLASDIVIADSTEILKYLYKKYNAGHKISYISYGADIPETPLPIFPLKKFNLAPKDYFIVVCRLEPENLVHTIIEGYVQSNVNRKLVIVGPIEGSKKYVRRLLNFQKYKGVVFLGGVYKKETIISLRFHCLAYFHGHSVGGTNPSLLEAMACGNFIIAHDNPFNRATAGNTAVYFKDSGDITRLLSNQKNMALFKEMNEKSQQRIRQFYNWEHIVQKYLHLLQKK